MYVCLCKAVTDKDIHQAVEQGARSMRELKCLNGVGGQCGRCTCHAKEVLAEAIAGQRQQAPQQPAPLPGSGMMMQGGSITSATSSQVEMCYP